MRDGPGDGVGEVSGDEGDVWGGGAIGGDAGGEVEIEECKVAFFNRADKRITAGIV